VGSTPELAKQARKGLLTYLNIDEPQIDPAEKVEREEDIVIKPIHTEQNMEEDDETSLLLETKDRIEDLPCVIIKPCKVPLKVRGESGMEKTVLAYIDSGAAATFCSPELVEGLSDVKM